MIPPTLPFRVRASIAGLILAFLGAACSLPPVDLSKAQPLALRSTIVAADGTVLAHLTGQSDCTGSLLAKHLCGENRVELKSAQIPQSIKNAVVAIEDARYWQHGAFDARGLLRAFVTNAAAGAVLQGGSTITQQLAKLMYTDPDTRRTLSTKIRELRYALALERTYTKDQILTMYLNRAYFGALAYGVAAASETYFNKPIAKIDLAEAALLAGLVKEPTTLDPFNNPKDAMRRRNTVIGRMLAEHMITQADATAAEREKIVVHHPVASCRQDKLPYFVNYVEHEVKTDPLFGKTQLDREERLYRGGLTIKTTIDPKWQAYAQNAVDRGTSYLSSNPDSALVAIDPHTGEIKAMASTQHNFCKNPYDPTWYGTPGPIPGSTFKPFDLGAALEQGISPESMYSGNQHNLRGKYGFLKEQKNDDHDYGLVTLRYGMQQSINAVYMRLTLDIGPDNVADFAHRAGVTSDLRCVGPRGERVDYSCPSIGIGQVNVTPLQMANAYGTFANDGVYIPAHGVAQIRDPHGKVMFDDRKLKGKQTIDPNVAYQITNVLESVACCGTARPANIGRPIAAKTGTSDAHHDVWLIGYTPDLVTAVWVGHIDHRGSLGASAWGATVAAPIWRTFMGAALAGTPVHDFVNPPGALNLHFHANTSGNKCKADPNSPAPLPTLCPSSTTVTTTPTTSTTPTVHHHHHKPPPPPPTQPPPSTPPPSTPPPSTPPPSTPPPTEPPPKGTTKR